MNKKNSNLEAIFLHFTAATALTLIIFLSTNVEKGECLSTNTGSYLEKVSCLSGNASACNSGAGDEAEYVMDEFEISRRVLATTPIGYNAFKKDFPFCSAKVMASCIGPDGKFYKKRGCGLKELCRS